MEMRASIGQLIMNNRQPLYSLYDQIEHTKNLYFSIKPLVIQAKYSFAVVYLSLVRDFAVISTILMIQNIKAVDPGRSVIKTKDTPPPLPGEISDHLRWVRRSVGNGAGLFILGWICPGSGQFLQNRLIAGGFFFVGFFSSIILTGLMLGTDIITPKGAEYLAWVSTLLQLAAMIEAPVRMKPGV